jgi:hypothetical protein
MQRRLNGSRQSRFAPDSPKKFPAPFKKFPAQPSREFACILLDSLAVLALDG